MSPIQTSEGRGLRKPRLWACVKVEPHVLTTDPVRDSRGSPGTVLAGAHLRPIPTAELLSRQRVSSSAGASSSSSLLRQRTSRRETARTAWPWGGIRARVSKPGRAALSLAGLREGPSLRLGSLVSHRQEPCSESLAIFRARRPEGAVDGALIYPPWLFIRRWHVHLVVTPYLSINVRPAPR